MTARARALVAAILVFAAICQPAAAANRYDPRFRFRTIATARFNIYFHQDEERVARRLARIAEEVADRMAPQLGVANGRVHVILVDQSDLSNGWAIAAPYNVIEITAAAPAGLSSIGNTDDWLRLVFSHEYTHIVHLDKARGWLGSLRRLFGRSPVLYPNLFLPLWQIEGIATYNESVVAGRGRVPAGDFHMIVNRAAAERRFDPIDRASGGLVAWPAGAAQYVYGAYFHQYLADRFGPESIVRLADDTSGRLPYFGARAFRKLFGRSLGELWDDFEADTKRRAAAAADPPVRLTHHGFSTGAPAFTRGGRLFYSTADPHGFPALMELPRNGSPRRVAERYLGDRIAAAGSVLVFDQIEYVNNVALRSDLYVVREDGGPVHRVTRGARAKDPDVSPDGATIACTVQSADRRVLATMSMPVFGQTGSPVPLLDDEWTDYSSPRWSPDGRQIAVERRRVNGPYEIVLVDPTTRDVRTLISSSGARSVSPFWLDTGTILFASDRNGEPFAIYSVDVATGAMRKLQGTGTSAQSPAVSPDGRDLVFVGYTADGYDLFSLPLASAVWTAVDAESVADAPPATPVSLPAISPADAAYRPWRTLVPQYWTPILESDGEELSAGAATTGMDALGRHGYASTLAWTTAHRRPDWSIAYAYDRWWPTLFASVADDADPWQHGEIRTREFNAGALFVARQVRRTQTALASFHASTDTFDCADCSAPLDSAIRRRAVRLGWSFDSRRSYGYSVSDESGTLLRTTWEAAPASLGSQAGTGAMTFDVRAYVPGARRHTVFAVRAAGATAWGNEHARRSFSAAGSGPQNRGFDVGSDAVGLLRGIDTDTVVGEHAAVANADFRFPLRTFERGVGTVPVMFRTLHAALFADAGHAWTGRFRWADVRASAGAELSLDAVLGYALPVTFTTGVAWREDAVAARRGVAVFGRIGRAF